MGTVQNITGGDLYVPLIGQTITANESVEVADDLLDPSVNLWPPANFLVNGEPHVQPEPVEPPDGVSPVDESVPPEPAPDPVTDLTIHEQGE